MNTFMRLVETSKGTHKVFYHLGKKYGYTKFIRLSNGDWSFEMRPNKGFKRYSESFKSLRLAKYSFSKMITDGTEMVLTESGYTKILI